MKEVIWPEEFPELETERLLLRRVSPEDSQGIFECFSSPVAMRYMGTPLDDRDSVEGIVEDYRSGHEEGHGMVWALEERKGGAFAGTAGFEEFSFLDYSAGISFTLLDSMRGRGFMGEALGAILSYCFNSMKLNRVQALVLPENTGAVKLLKGLGFSTEGLTRQSVFFRGAFHDQLILSLLEQDVR